MLLLFLRRYFFSFFVCSIMLVYIIYTSFYAALCARNVAFNGDAPIRPLDFRCPIVDHTYKYNV